MHAKLITRVFLAGSLLLAGCSKGSVSPEDASAQLLVGRWELTQTDGGLSGQVHPSDPSQKREIVFDANNRVTFLLNGAVKGTSSYSLYQANSYVNRRPQTFFAYGARRGSDKEFIERLSAAQLVVVEDYADGTGYYYTRR
jgi:hypothetical protein